MLVVGKMTGQKNKYIWHGGNWNGREGKRHERWAQKEPKNSFLCQPPANYINLSLGLFRKML